MTRDDCHAPSLHFVLELAILTIPDCEFRDGREPIFEGIFQIWIFFPDLGPPVRQAYSLTAMRAWDRACR
jgi:hypothetical protein